MKNLLITGSTGFIGKKLVKKLAKNFNVWCLQELSKLKIRMLDILNIIFHMIFQ